ncbi:hypothetical protein PVAND_010168 [Polypedilum vanderplanki]|uniref:Uncharacterized protein n=1 Tax=Polypedilum vanderplanki TaxID=319348 RepID=A0A9J6CEX1_POLVA|nr:hypothetical protein PVAND_010168 [Polypedilum vanderplanki]
MWRRILLLCFLIYFADCGVIRKRQATRERETQYDSSTSILGTVKNTLKNVAGKVFNRNQNSNLRESDFMDSDDSNQNNYNKRERSQTYGASNDNRQIAADQKTFEHEQPQKSNIYTNNQDRLLNSETTEKTRQIYYAQIESQAYVFSHQTEHITPVHQQPYNPIYPIANNQKPQNDPILYQPNFNQYVGSNQGISNQYSGNNQDINRNNGYALENKEKVNTNEKEYGLIDDKRGIINLGSTPTSFSTDNERKTQVMIHTQDENPIVAPNEGGKIEIEFPPTISYDENSSTTTRASILDFIKNSRTTQRNYNERSFNS